MYIERDWAIWLDISSFNNNELIIKFTFNNSWEYKSILKWQKIQEISLKDEFLINDDFRVLWFIQEKYEIIECDFWNYNELLKYYIKTKISDWYVITRTFKKGNKIIIWIENI